MIYYKLITDLKKNIEFSDTSVICTNLLWIPQVKEVQVALVTHLLVCGEHDDVAAEIKAARSDS